MCSLVGRPTNAGPGEAVFDPERPVAPRYDVDETYVLTAEAAQQLLTDPSLLRLAQLYLGARPVQDLVAMWWSAAVSGGTSAAAQEYHFDLDRLSFVKFFVYVTDVGPRQGPHVFVRGTHRRLPRAFREDHRYTTSTVEQAFPDDVVRVFGERGTMFVADTRGLHKGLPVEHGARLMFQLQYASSLFGAPYRRITLPASTPALAESIRRYPGVYGRFATAS
jgi:hypothetical protein